MLNWRDERGCDEDHWHDHIKGLPWGLPEVVGTVQQAHCSRRRLLRRGLEFYVCTINKSAHTKKAWKHIYWSSLYYHHHHGMPLSQISLALSHHSTCPYRPSLSVGLPCYIMYQNRAVVDKFSWSPYPYSSVWGCPLEGIAYEFAHISPALSEPMTSIDQQGSRLGTCPTFPSPNPHYNLTFGSLDLVSSPV